MNKIPSRLRRKIEDDGCKGITRGEARLLVNMITEKDEQIKRLNEQITWLIQDGVKEGVIACRAYQLLVSMRRQISGMLEEMTQ